MAYEYIYGSDTVEEGTRKINQNFLQVPVAENVLTEANNYADTVGTNTLNSAKTYANTTFSNPNLLINGDFQVWQKGESFNAAGYTADRSRNAQTNTAVSKIQHL